MEITNKTYLQAMGGVETNSLIKKLESNSNENDENDQIQIIRHSSYYDKEKFENLIKSKTNSFSILSTNIQSINSKFGELKIYVEYLKEEHNFEFSAICLHEFQFKETVSTKQFNLENYKLIPQGKPINPCSAKGG